MNTNYEALRGVMAEKDAAIHDWEKRFNDLRDAVLAVRCEDVDWPNTGWSDDKRTAYLDGYDAARKKVREVVARVEGSGS